MMKTYSIGRDLNCDIVINDSTDVISRRHALLNVTPSGKMTIVDQSSNGTYVNGIRISPNVPVPVTRKDIVSLAHVAKLDWNQIPRENQWLKYVIALAAAVMVIIGVICGLDYFKKSGGDVQPEGSSIQQVDSAALKQKEIARQDSLKKVAREDSLKKVQREDSIRREASKAKKSEKPAKDQAEKPAKPNETKPKDSKGQQKNDSTRSARAVG